MRLVAAILPFVACGCLAEPERHLIPSGYVGYIYIVFGARDGEPAVYDGHTRVYRIPRDGILRTQLLPNLGWSWRPRHSFFFVDSASGKETTEITTEWTSTIDDTDENRSDHSVGIFGRGDGVIGARISGPEDSTQVWSSEAPCSVRYESYLVGTKSDVLGATEDPFKRLDNYLRSRPLPCE